MIERAPFYDLTDNELDALLRACACYRAKKQSLRFMRGETREKWNDNEAIYSAAKAERDRRRQRDEALR